MSVANRFERSYRGNGAAPNLESGRSTRSWFISTGQPVCETVAEPSGHYRIGVPAGEYYVEFFDTSRNYIPQLYDDRSFAERPDLCAPQPRDMSVAAKQPADIARQCPYIRSLAALGLEHGMAAILLCYKG